MNLPKYLVEYMGTLVICATMLYTHHNPIFVSLALLVALYIGKEVVDGYFSPLAVIISYGVGHMNTETALYNLIAQITAVLSLIVTYEPLKVYMTE